MFLLGLLGFFQSVFIPGYLLIKYIKILPENSHGLAGGLQRLVYGFGLSLAVNYLLVFYLTLLGLYTPFVYYFIILVEILLILYGWWKDRNKSENSNRYTLDIPKLVESVKAHTTSQPLIYNLLLIAGLFVLSLYIFYFLYFLGSVFMHWDPAVAWNRFAIEWSQNQLPTHTWRYPQLMPANWSVSYVLMQNAEVQCFAKAIMPLFSISILLLFAQMAIRKKQAVYWLGLVLYGVLASYLYDPSVIVSGYVDTGVSFFAFLAFHVMYNREEGVPKIILATLFAAIAAVTKQAGLFILGITLVWAIGKLIHSRKRLSIKKILSVLLGLILIVSVITASWYLLKEVHIGSGIDTSEVNMVQSANKSPQYFKRFLGGLKNILTARTAKLRFIPISIFGLFIFGIFHTRSRFPALAIALPYALIWGLFFSYDSRNLALAVPFIAFSASFGAETIGRKLSSIERLPRIRIPLIPLVILLVIVLAGLNFTLLKESRIIRHQDEKKMQLGEPRLNRLLYKYYKKNGFTGKIATNYQYLSILPQMKDYFFIHVHRLNLQYLDWLETPEATEIHYLLTPVPFKHEKEVYRRYRHELKTGHYRLIFKHNLYRFIKINRQTKQ